MNAPSAEPKPLRVALLLSTEYFEEFYGDNLGLTRSAYVSEYRNDWSWDWVEMLCAADVNVSIYVPTIGPSETAQTEGGTQIRFLGLGEVARPWIKYPALRRTPVGRWTAQIAMATAFLRPLRAALSADQVDVLCVQEYWTGRFDLLVRSLDVPVVTVDQGLPGDRELKLLKRGSFARCRGAITQTQGEARVLRRWGAPATRIPNAVRSDFYTPGPTGNEARIVCVGRLHDAQKRLSDVIAALAILPHDAWSLDIAGTGPDEQALRTLAAHLGVGDRIRFLGFVQDRSRLRELYRAAGVFALPSAYEGLPMVLLEAMSCGAAVVGSDIPAITEVVEHERTGLIVAPGDPAALARALTQAHRRRAELGAAAREEILRTYDQGIVGPRLRDFLQSATRPK